MFGCMKLKTSIYDKHMDNQDWSYFAQKKRCFFLVIYIWMRKIGHIIVRLPLFWPYPWLYPIFGYMYITTSCFLA